LVVFNGGISDDRKWTGYPALLACQERGPSVEISKAVSRRVLKDIDPGLKPDSVEFSYSVAGYTNGYFHLKGVQRPPVDTTKPLHIRATISKEDVLNAMNETRARGERRKYAKAEYFIEP
jgi:hypothetical protein